MINIFMKKPLFINNNISKKIYSTWNNNSINVLLQEYKSKENNTGFYQAKNSATFYQVKNLPIKFLEIPGYEDNYSLKKSVKILIKVSSIFTFLIE
jgi:hypothetical protein